MGMSFFITQEGEFYAAMSAKLSDEWHGWLSSMQIDLGRKSSFPIAHESPDFDAPEDAFEWLTTNWPGYLPAVADDLSMQSGSGRECFIEVFDEAEPASNALLQDELRCLFALGIVNPFGPTLTFVAVSGDMKKGEPLPIISVMLNPFKQESSVVGLFTPGTEWQPTSDLQPLFDLDYGACPTLLMMGADIGEDSRESVAYELLVRFADVASTYSRVERHYGDPWERVSEEMAGKDSQPPGIDKEEAAQRFADIVVRPEHFWPEFRAFFYAWRGSVEETGIPADMKEGAMTVEVLQKILFERLAPTLWIPEELKQN
jgi:hypothetical protein